MRKNYKFQLLGLLLAMAVTAFGQGVGVPITATAPTIDGDVSDAAWAAASPMDIDHVSSGVMDDAFAAEYSLMWDTDHLYVAVSVLDDTLTNTNGPNVFAQDQNDFIDIYIDMDRRFPYTFINPFGDGPGSWVDPAIGGWNGSWWNLYDENDFQIQLLRDDALLGIGGQFPGRTIDGPASGITVAQQEVTGGYTFEVAIPFDNLIEAGFDAVHNARLGFEIMVGDADTKGVADTVRDGRVAWNMEEGVDLAWQDPELWGVVVLDDGSGVSLPALNPAVDQAATAPSIDGAADAMWNDIPFREINNTSSGLMDLSFAADFKAMWDTDNLYLLVNVKDDTLTNTNGPLAFAQDQNDFIDIYIDMDRRFPYTFINPFGDGPGSWVDPAIGGWNGSWWNLYDENDFQIQLLRDDDMLGIGGQFPGQTIDGAASGITVAQQETAGGYMVELAIPLDNLIEGGFEAVHNARLGFEIMVGDADTKGVADTVRDGRVAWNMEQGVDQAWADPELWGVLVLSDGSAISAPAETPEIMEATTAPAIDGTVDALWSSVDFREIRNTTDGTMDSAFIAEFKAVWDDTNLYLLVEVDDEELTNDNTPSGLAQDQNDYIDIYLDTDMKFPYTFLNPFGDGPGGWVDPAIGGWNGSWWSFYDTTDFQIKFLRDAAFLEIGGQHPDNSVDSASSGITYAQAEVAGGWLLEVSIPWTNMDPNFVPSHDMPFGLEVVVGDADADTIRNGRNAWFETDDLAWQQPLLWGTAILSDGGKIESKVLSLENDLLSTSLGEIDAENNAIIKIPKYTTVTELAAAVTVSAGATAEVYEKAAPVDLISEIAESGMVLRIWSEKGLWNDVALELEKLPTGFFEDFEAEFTAADTAIWFTADAGYSLVFGISHADTVLQYDMSQSKSSDSIIWQPGMLNLTDAPLVSLDIKIEGATYDDGTGAVSVTTLPVEISIYSPDPAGGDDICAGNFVVDVPAADAGAGSFATYYFDLTQGDQWDPAASPALIDTVTWIMVSFVNDPGVYAATISIDMVGIGTQAEKEPMPVKTGFSEDFEGTIDMDIWDANRGTHADGTTRIFQVSGDNGALKVEMNQTFFADGEMFIFTKEEWLMDVSDPVNQIVSMKVKVEDATWDGVAITEIPFQVSFFALVPDPVAEQDFTRVGSLQIQIPVAAAGAGEFTEYWFDLSGAIASADEHNQAQVDKIWAVLVETVYHPGLHVATYWLDDIKMGDEVTPYVPSDDASIHETLYGTLGADEITMVDPTLTVTAFSVGLTVHELATVTILESSGGSEVADPNRTSIATGMVVVVTAEDGTISEYAITTDPTGIHRLNEESIALYPNPTTGILNVSHAGAYDRVMIANITGQVIEEVEIKSNSLILDVSDYDAGVYFITLESGEYGTVVRKFIKE